MASFVEMILDDFVPVINYHVHRKCTPDWRIWPQTITDFDLTYIVRGTARYIINGETHELESGDLLFLSPGDNKEATTYSKNLMHCFATNFAFKNQPLKKIDGSAFFPIVNRIGLRQDIINLFRELTIGWTRQQSGYILKTRALLMLILHRFSEIIMYEEDSPSVDYRVSKVINFISQHYSEKLTVKDLARQVHLDADYFGQLFKREMGYSVHQCITNIRVRNAENTLQTGAYKVHEVAEQCGFSDSFHFYKSFKALRGFPPSRCLPKV
ncbi:MAG: AraC family transcriptional regulator [Spirochaetaceae bacterium]|nr:AraC family transcriptional regulator [Spirochaetaceae bacterium]